jgi:hypothetical protein
MHHLVINVFNCSSLTSPQAARQRGQQKPSRFFYMKHLIDLSAFCLSLGKIHHGLLQKSEPDKKNSFGSFSVHAVLPAVKNLFTYAVDENLFFEFYGPSSDYSKLDALQGIWSKKLTPKNTKSTQ